MYLFIFLATYLLLLLCSTTFAGIDSIEMKMKDKKMTVIGDVDPVDVVKKVRRKSHVKDSVLPWSHTIISHILKNIQTVVSYADCKT